jgi:protein SCO1
MICSAGTLGQASSKDYFTDTVVVDQDGKSRRFFTDLMDGKVVIINAFHTDCNITVPPMTVLLRKLQTNLAGRSKEFNIISLSVDPADTAARTKAFAEKYKAGPGWYFITGEKANMEIVLKKLGFYVTDKEQNSTLLIVGNTKTGLWKKVYGLASADEIQKAVVSVLDDVKK